MHLFYVGIINNKDAKKTWVPDKTGHFIGIALYIMQSNKYNKIRRNLKIRKFQ